MEEMCWTSFQLFEQCKNAFRHHPLENKGWKMGGEKLDLLNLFLNGNLFCSLFSSTYQYPRDRALPFSLF